MLRFFLPFVILLILVSCKKEVKPEQSPPGGGDPDNLEVLWQKPLVEEGSAGSLSIAGFAYKDYVYFSDEYAGTLKGYPMAGDGEVRELGEGSFYGDPGRHSHILQESQLYYRSIDSKINVLDMESGNIQQLYDGGTWMGPRVSYSNGHLYFEQPSPDRSTLLNMDVANRQIDTVMDYAFSSGWQGSFEPPLAFERNGRNFLAFQLRADGLFPLTYNRQDYYLYDADADTLVWRNVFADSLEGSTGKPVVDDQHVYWMGNTSVFAYDIETGDLVWEHKNEDEKGHWHGIMFMYDDILYVKSDGTIMVGLEPATGQVRMINRDCGSTPSRNYEVVDGVFCFYSRGKGKFVAVDLNTGNRLMYEGAPVKNASGNYTMGSSIVIDPDTRRLYYTNYYDVVCAEIAPFE